MPGWLADPPRPPGEADGQDMRSELETEPSVAGWRGGRWDAVQSGPGSPAHNNGCLGNGVIAARSGVHFKKK